MALIVILIFTISGCNKKQDINKFTLSEKFADRLLHFNQPIVGKYTKLVRIKNNIRYYALNFPSFEFPVEENNTKKMVKVPPKTTYFKIYVQDNVMYRESCIEGFTEDKENIKCTGKTIVLSNQPWEIHDNNFTIYCKIDKNYKKRILNEGHLLIETKCSDTTYAIYADGLGIVETGILGTEDINKIVGIDDSKIKQR